MRFRIPGKDIHVRLFERVDAPEGYDVFDTGLEYQDGNIDSLAVGGSFYTARQWCDSQDTASLKQRQKAEKKAAKKAAKKQRKAEEAAAAAQTVEVAATTA